ncbi:MAG: hypothetical protein COA79_21865 [Planctomycetota bacterium]|nr:MAG: hypothetical protein COA79_21865 [Planctomycetota bacterium]
MKKIKVVISLSFIILVLFTIPTLLADTIKRDVLTKPCVVITGTDSHVSKRGYQRITSKKDWIRAWEKNKGQKLGNKYDHNYNSLGLPLIDFERYMVIAIFQGSGRNSRGLKAISVSEEQYRIAFRFDDESYQTIGGHIEVAVYGFFIIPRSSKPLILEENVQGLNGKPPVWKKRITFPKI